MRKFDPQNKRLAEQFKEIHWDPESGIGKAELEDRFGELMKNENGYSRAVLKAKTLELIAEESRVAADPDDIFQDKLYGGNLLSRQRTVWEEEVIRSCLPAETQKVNNAWSRCGAYHGHSDFGHTSPNSELLLRVGFPGLLQRVETAASRDGLTEKQKDFYESCRITLRAAITYLSRLAQAIEPFDVENADALRNLTKGAPANTYEAMQLLIAYFFFHEYVGKTRVRTLGRLDVLLYPFYKKDIENGVFTKEEIREMLKFFLNKFWTADVPYGLPFCLGGGGTDGREVTNELSYLIVETYRDLSIYSPKIHIRVSEKTPADFIRLVLRCIREGKSSFVFVNDAVAVKALKKVGITEEDAVNYVPIGCYEPAVWGSEIGCTGNGGVNLAKACELVMTNGVDCQSGELCGVRTGEIRSYEEFLDAVKKQIRYMADEAMSYITKIERYYGQIGPDPLLSSMYDSCMEKGVDAFEGGAKYNNSSLYFWCIATLADSVAAVRKLVFEDQTVTFAQLCGILKNDWEGYETLRLKARKLSCKYGNNDARTDSIAAELSRFAAEICNNRPNGRGGVFKAALFCIDRFVYLGERTMATPEGRRKGEILSKNLCASVGMDRNGITALISSVTKMDLSDFPNGSVLDFVLHPSAVQGEDGLDAFYQILSVYFGKGGFAMHGNIMNADELKEAQKNPEKYKNLQVRVCGWNAYFVDLRKEEQDAFIRQAECLG